MLNWKRKVVDTRVPLAFTILFAAQGCGAGWEANLRPLLVTMTAKALACPEETLLITNLHWEFVPTWQTTCHGGPSWTCELYSSRMTYSVSNHVECRPTPAHSSHSSDCCVTHALPCGVCPR